MGLVWANHASGSVNVQTADVVCFRNLCFVTNFIDSRSQVLFQAFELMRVLISRLANLWLHRKVSYSTVCLTGRYSAHSRNLGGRCFKRYKQKMEGAGNAEMMLFHRRVLLETFDEKRFLHF